MANEAQYNATRKTRYDGQRTMLETNSTGVLLVDGSGGGTTPTAAKQFTTTTTPAIATANATVFTLVAGEKGIIQNLHTTALAVRYGASASTTVFTFILKGGTATDDGLGGSCIVDDWIGAVSVAAMSGSPRFVASKLS